MSVQLSVIKFDNQLPRERCFFQTRTISQEDPIEFSLDEKGETQHRVISLAELEKIEKNVKKCLSPLIDVIPTKDFWYIVMDARNLEENKTKISVFFTRSWRCLEIKNENEDIICRDPASLNREIKILYPASDGSEKLLRKTVTFTEQRDFFDIGKLQINAGLGQLQVTIPIKAVDEMLEQAKAKG